mgnify:FL=1
MKPRYATLGESIYSKIDRNEYLHELYETILYNYSMTLIGDSKRKKPIKKEHALRFADILSKSYGTPNSEKHRAWAQEIVALLNAIYPDDASVKAYATSILSTIGNYHGLELIKTRYKNISFLDDLFESFDLEYLKIPHQENMYFFHPQKEIYDHLNDSAFSYSGPTSLGKSLIMRMFIKDKIVNGFKGNFAILVPTKALISEISTSIINQDLKEELANKGYKVVTSGNSLFFKQDNINYIMVMTPERMLYALMSFPQMTVDFLFIDEAHKIGEKDGRSTFYFKVVDMLLQREKKPRIILASPNIPNPEEYLKIIPNGQNLKTEYLKTSFTPVSQMKYVIDTVSHEFKVYNEHSINKEKFIKISDIDENYETIDLIKEIVKRQENKSNLIYCSGRQKAVELARAFAENIQPLNDPVLDKIAEEIKDEIHTDYYLADLITKGVAYHVGYLPIHIRTKIEELYRKRLIKTIFCTSTLIEGVNLPADNLIVIKCRMGSKGNMSQIEFRNLLGRVGRIQYNLYGNVFIIRDRLTSEKTIDKLLVKPVENQHIALMTELSNTEKEYIVSQFAKGDSQLRAMDGQNNEQYEFMRKTGLILLKDITSDRDSVVRKQFDGFLDENKIQAIKNRFSNATKDKPKPDDDINVSVDQTTNLINAINNGLEYPQLVNGRVQYDDLVYFLRRLRDIFKWDIYEKDTLGYGERFRYYAVILSRWINGYGLALLLKDTLEYNERNHCFVQINRQSVPYDGSQEHKNIVIGDTLQIIENVILFSIANYFLRFSTEYKKLKTNGQPFNNDWYEYVEYGSTNPLTIFLQRNGLSREASDYIRQHPEFIARTKDGYKLKRNILECKKDAIRDELNDIQFNIPELFVE